MVAAASVPITVALEMKRCPTGTEDVALAGRAMAPVTTWSNDVELRVAAGRVAWAGPGWVRTPCGRVPWARAA
jgi:hypothetical protein